MNTKKIAIILGVGIILLVGVSAFLLMRTGEKPASQEKPVVVSQSTNYPVVFNGKTLTPSSLSLKKGNAVSFSNTSDKAIIITIISKTNPGLSQPKISISAGKTASSPTIQEDGTYEFKELIGDIVGDKVLNGTSFFDHSVTPKIAPFAEVTVGDSGFTPSNSTIKSNSLVRFINKTSKTIEITWSGSDQMLPTAIEAGKTGISLVFVKVGSYDFALKNNPGIKGTIIVQ